MGLKKGPGPPTITTHPNIPFWRQCPGSCSGCPLLPEDRSFHCFRINGLSNCQEVARIPPPA